MSRVWLFVCAVVMLQVATIASAREWSDKSGKFRIDAELVAVRGGKAYLEKKDGSVVTVPVERLSQPDQDYLASLEQPKPTQPASEPTSPAPNKNPSKVDASKVDPGKAASPRRPTGKPVDDAPAGVAIKVAPNELARQVVALFENKCHRCHGQDGTNEGGFNYILNLGKLNGAYVVPGKPKESLLYERMADPSEDTAMPPSGEEPRPTKSEVDLVRQWIMAGAPSANQAPVRSFVTNEQVLTHVLDDLLAAQSRSRRFLRYFTLTHLYNSNMSEDELQTYRLAFTKLLNGLSWSEKLVVPRAIDPAKTIFCIDIRDVNWNDKIWEEVTRANPYFLRLATADAKKCYEESQSEMPFVRIDWFVFAASKPPLYHAILGIPATDRELERLLRIDAEANIEQERVVRAAFNRSGVSQNNRMIERHTTPYGGYWKSYDFAGNVGNQNLFDHPLGPHGVDAFQHDGGEMIFTLPNGMQGYMLTDNSGNRIDKGPTEIVSDPKRPDRAVVNGVSCMTCHYAGMIPKADEIRPFVEASRKAFEDPETILAIYPGQKVLDKHYDEDGKRYVAALQAIGIKKASKTGEPVSTMASRFEQELDLVTTAAEFGLTPEQFDKRLSRNEAEFRVLASLRVAGGTIKRDVFVEQFGRAAFEFGMTTSSERATASSGRSSSLPSNSESPSRSTGLVKIEGPKGGGPGEVRKFTDIGISVESLAFSPNGGLLAVGLPLRTLILKDVVNSTEVYKNDKLENLQAVTCVAFTPDGKRLLAGGSSGKIIVWDIDKAGNLRQVSQFVGHNDNIGLIAISRDSRHALSVSKDQRVRYWTIQDGHEVHSFAVDGLRRIQATYIKSDGKTGLASDGTELLHLDLKRGVVERAHKFGKGSTEAVAFSPDGNQVVVADGHRLNSFAVDTGLPMGAPYESKDYIWSAVFTPNGKWLLAGGKGKFDVWDTTMHQRVFSQQVGDGTTHIKMLAISPDSMHVATISRSIPQSLHIFRLPDEKR